MHAEERHQAILRRLRERGTLRVSDVADELGVSPVTVRRDIEILADRGLVARVHGGAVLPETRAETTGTEGPTRAAAARGPLSFGLIVPAADYYYPEVIKGAQEAAGERGIRLVLGISQYNPDEEHAQARRMLADGLDGLLVATCDPTAAAPWLGELTIPHVLVERRPGDELSDTERVVTDHVHGARLAVRHLARTRRRIGLLVRDDSPHSGPLVEGYSRAWRRQGSTRLPADSSACPRRPVTRPGARRSSTPSPPPRRRESWTAA